MSSTSQQADGASNTVRRSSQPVTTISTSTATAETATASVAIAPAPPSYLERLKANLNAKGREEGLSVGAHTGYW